MLDVSISAVYTNDSATSVLHGDLRSAEMSNMPLSSILHVNDIHLLVSAEADPGNFIDLLGERTCLKGNDFQYNSPR